MRRVEFKGFRILFITVALLLLVVIVGGLNVAKSNEEAYAVTASTTAPGSSFVSMHTNIASSASDIGGNGGEGYGNLFDGNTGTKYCYPGAVATVTVTYKNAFVLRAYAIATANDTASQSTRNLTSWTILGSNDGTTYKTITHVDNSSRAELPAEKLSVPLFLHSKRDAL